MRPLANPTSRHRNLTVAAFLLSAAISPLACNRSNQSPQLSNAQAQETIQANWNEGTGFRVYLGNFEVTRETTDIAKGRLAVSRMKLYKAWEDIGLVKIKLLKDLTARFSGWNDWNKLFLDGVQSVVQIEPTEKGMPLKKTEKGELQAFLEIPRGKFLVEEIIKREPLRLGIDDYEVIWGTHTANYTPEALSYYERIGVKVKKDRKFRALLRYDPFKPGWQVVVEDIADRDQEFLTDNVNDTIRKWGSRN